jgi:hypothetical protein
MFSGLKVELATTADRDFRVVIDGVSNLIRKFLSGDLGKWYATTRNGLSPRVGPPARKRIRQRPKSCRSKQNAGSIADKNLTVPDVSRQHGVRRMAGLRPNFQCRDARLRC